MSEYMNKELFLRSMGLTGDETKYGNRDAEHQYRSYSTYMSYEIMDSVEDSIVEDVAPVRHGRWLEYENDADRGYHYCSHCKRQAINYSDGGVITEVLSPYCPYCGAKMDTEETKWH